MSDWCHRKRRTKRSWSSSIRRRMPAHASNFFHWMCLHPMCVFTTPDGCATCEHNIIRSKPGLCPCNFTTTIAKCCKAGTFPLTCQNKNKGLNDKWCIHGVNSAGNECHLQPLIMPNIPANHPDSNEHNFSAQH